ncbi:MAG: hypothetical protein KFF73_19625 [Cyclobacteriaceae bacterium]|nr:hypothetical protein [Cyclobacteriaceae bacterium]
MVETILSGLAKYLTVYLISMLKFVGGPTLGAAVGLTFLETVILTILGMMTTVLVISLFGHSFREWLNRIFRRDKKLFTKRNRKFVVFWKRYGLFGVSFLTPVIFSPILGTLLVHAFGGSTRKILGYMLISAVFWSFALSKFFQFIPQIIQP